MIQQWVARRFASTTVLRGILLLVPQGHVSLSSRFFSEGLGLQVSSACPAFTWVDLLCSNDSNNNSTVISIKETNSEASCSTGYSPILHFEVESLDSVMGPLISLGGRMDGPIKYKVNGKFAVLRSPCGQMIGLQEVDKETIR